MNLPIKSSVGYTLQASKWLTCHVLLETSELKDLFQALGQFEIYLVSGVIPNGKENPSQAEFLEVYDRYIQGLKRGIISEDTQLRQFFSSVLTTTSDALYSVPLSDARQLVKIQKPVIQLQTHRFHYSFDDGKFRSMVFGPDSISWGIQFSYPQIFQDSNMEVQDVKNLSNTKLFKDLQTWVRHNTLATPFVKNQKKTNVPIRLGRGCLSWINNHPQLQQIDLRVHSE